MCVCALKLFCTIRPDAGPNEHRPPVMALAKLKQHTQNELIQQTTLANAVTHNHTYTYMQRHTLTQKHTHTCPPADPITQRCATRWKQIYPEKQLI